MKLFFIIGLTLLLSACTEKYIGEKKNKNIPEGKRIPVVEIKESFIPKKDEKIKNIVLPKPQPIDEWPMPGGIAHHSVQHIASKAVFDISYKTSIGMGSSYRDKLLGDPIAVNDKIYTVDVNAVVTETDISTGKILWSKRLEPLFSTMGHVLQGVGVSYDDGKLFVALGSGEIQAINIETKEPVWKKMLPTPLRSAPLAYGGRIYAQSADNKVTAMSSFNGDILWSHDFGAEGAVIMGVPSPVADMGVVVFGLSVGEVVALRSDTGSFLWRSSVSGAATFGALEDMRDIKGRIIIDNNKVYVTSNFKTAVLNLKDGAVIWEKDIASLNNPVLAGDYLFLVTTDNYLLTVLEKNGETIAGIKLPLYEDEEDKTGRIFWTGPLLVEDKLVVANNYGKMRIYSPYTGKLEKETDIGEPVSIAMIVIKDNVIVLGDRGNLAVFK